MQRFIIQGGRRIQGAIAVNGAKNHALKAFAAALLSSETMELVNVPEIEDIFRLSDILRYLGVQVVHPRRGIYELTAKRITTTVLPNTLVPKLRAAIVLTGPLLVRCGAVTLPHPGGCAIGRRPIDMFIAGFKAMGVKHRERNGLHYFTAPHGLHGTQFVFPTITVTGTETLLLAATLAEGTTTLVNAAREPEIIALAEYLNTQGAHIIGAGSSKITIVGVQKLTAGRCPIIPDRIETLSFIFLALAANSRLTITQCDPKLIELPLQLLRTSGAKFEIKKDNIVVKPWKHLKPMMVSTQAYPGFPTDGQSPLTVLLTQIQGESEVIENIYADRLFFTDRLNRMGANITMHTPQHISVHGGTPLRGKRVESPDLRAGIAMVIAAIIAEGTTVIDNIYQIDRGYEAIDQRLRKLGVKIRRVNRYVSR